MLSFLTCSIKRGYSRVCVLPGSVLSERETSQPWMTARLDRSGSSWLSVQRLTWSFERFADGAYSIHNRTAWRLPSCLSLYKQTRAGHAQQWGRVSDPTVRLTHCWYILTPKTDKHAATGSSWLGKKHTGYLYLIYVLIVMREIIAPKNI